MATINLFFRSVRAVLFLIGFFNASLLWGGVEIPVDCRVPNRSGSQCVWVSLETLARFHKIEILYDLSQKYKGVSGPGIPEKILRQRGVFYWSRPMGRINLDDLKMVVDSGLGAMIGLNGTHAVVLVDIKGSQCTVIENSDRCRNRIVPSSKLDGWVIVLYPTEVKTLPKEIKSKTNYGEILKRLGEARRELRNLRDGVGYVE